MAQQELTLASEVEVRETCAECKGTGIMAGMPRCLQCGYQFSAVEVEHINARIERWAEHGGNPPVMDCGCLAIGMDDGRRGCQPCQGDGFVIRWVKLGDLVAFIGGQLAGQVACEHARPAFIKTRK